MCVWQDESDKRKNRTKCDYQKLEMCWEKNQRPRNEENYRI